MTPRILSSCHPVGQPDSMTRSYLVTLTLSRKVDECKSLPLGAAAAAVTAVPLAAHGCHRAPGDPGRGLHSSTFGLNVSRF